MVFMILIATYKYGQVKRDEWDIAKRSYEGMLENLSMVKHYEIKREEYLSKLKGSSFSKKLSQEMIISVLNNYTWKRSIQILNIKFSDLGLLSVDEDIEIVESGYGDGTGAGAGYGDDYGGDLDLDKCKSMGLTIEFKSSFDVLLDFIDDINQNENDISIRDIRIITWNEDLIYVVLDMKFYAVPIGV